MKSLACVSINRGFSLSCINNSIFRSFNKYVNNTDSSIGSVSFSNLMIISFYIRINFRITNNLKNMPKKLVNRPIFLLLKG